MKGREKEGSIRIMEPRKETEGKRGEEKGVMYSSMQGEGRRNYEREGKGKGGSARHQPGRRQRKGGEEKGVIRLRKEGEVWEVKEGSGEGSKEACTQQTQGRKGRKTRNEKEYVSELFT